MAWATYAYVIEGERSEVLRLVVGLPLVTRRTITYVNYVAEELRSSAVGKGPEFKTGARTFIPNKKKPSLERSGSKDN